MMNNLVSACNGEPAACDDWDSNTGKCKSSNKGCDGCYENKIADLIEQEEIKVAKEYNITKLHAGCYLCSGGRDEYICKTFNGGCERLRICQEIYANEQLK